MHYNLQNENTTKDMFLWTKNKFLSNPSNIKYFNRYFDLCIKAACEKSYNMNKRNEYLEECFSTLDIFCDYIFLNENTLKFIKSQQNKALKAADDIISYQYEILYKEIEN